MVFLNGQSLSELCDYSFGIHGGVLGGLPGFYVKNANIKNREFINQMHKIIKTQNYMTIFTDNLRLYRQKKQNIKISDAKYIKKMMRLNDTLELISNFQDIKFIIFTGSDDLEITHEIHDSIPDNVLKVYCVNATGFYDKVCLSPLGVNVKWSLEDFRQDILKQQREKNMTAPINLLYLNFDVNTNPERNFFLKALKDLDFVINDEVRLDHKSYYEKMSDCAFVLCPTGNGLDTHRIWEAIILRRVPIVPDTTFFRELLKDYTVLYAKNLALITKDLLINNYHLLDKAIKQNIDMLYTNNFYKKKVNEALAGVYDR